MITAKEIREYQDRKEGLKTIGEFKALGREIRDAHNLTDREALDILNDRNILEILSSHEGSGVLHKEEDEEMDSSMLYGDTK